MDAAGLWHPTALDYVGIVIVFALLCWLAGWIATVAEKAYRRWACRREMARSEEAARLKRQLAGLPRLASLLMADPGYLREAQRRDELDGLATAQDKTERRLH